MENLTLEQLKLLAQQTQRPSISIFLPTHRVGTDAQQDPIRLKNLLREAERQFLDKGMGPNEVGALLQPAQALIENTAFWQHQQDGLAVFIAPDDFHYYHLPFDTEELLVIAQSYYVKPILPLFMNNEHYYILAISQDAVRLFEATRHSVGQIEMPEDTPESLDEALRFDDPEKQLQFHSGTSQSAPQGGTRAGMFHGQGAGEDEQKEKIERYLNLVDMALKAVFREEKAPLVLAGVDYLLPIYHKVSEYANIMTEGIVGNPEHLRPEELQEQAWAIVEPYFHQETEKVIELYQQLAHTDKATDDFEEIVAAAFYGRVDRLVLAVGRQMWGVFNRETGKVVHYHEGQRTEDDLPLLDFAAMQTLQNGGTVYALTQDEMPTESAIAAVFRY